MHPLLTVAWAPDIYTEWVRKNCPSCLNAGIRRDNITGFRFLPENGGRVGLAVMRRFVGRA